MFCVFFVMLLERVARVHRFIARGSAVLELDSHRGDLGLLDRQRRRSRTGAGARACVRSAPLLHTRARSCSGRERVICGALHALTRGSYGQVKKRDDRDRVGVRGRKTHI